MVWLRLRLGGGGGGSQWLSESREPLPVCRRGSSRLWVSFFILATRPPRIPHCCSYESRDQGFSPDLGDHWVLGPGKTVAGFLDALFKCGATWTNAIVFVSAVSRFIFFHLLNKQKTFLYKCAKNNGIFARRARNAKGENFQQEKTQTHIHNVVKQELN